MQRGDRRPDDAHREGDNTPPDLEHDDRGQSRDRDVRDADDEPVPLEDLVEAREEPRVQGLRVAGRPAGQEPERPARDQRLREAVALLDELLEDRCLARRRGRLAAGRPRRRARSRSLGRVSSRLRGETGAGTTAVSSHARCQSSSTSRHQSRWPWSRSPLHVLVRAGASTTLGCSCSRARARASRSVSPASSRKRTTEPVAERNPEAGLPSCGELRWNEIRERTPQARPSRADPRNAGSRAARRRARSTSWSSSGERSSSEVAIEARSAFTSRSSGR